MKYTNKKRRKLKYISRRGNTSLDITINQMIFQQSTDIKCHPHASTQQEEDTRGKVQQFRIHTSGQRRLNTQVTVLLKKKIIYDRDFCMLPLHPSAYIRNRNK
jgi:hypothetical protein